MATKFNTPEEERAYSKGKVDGMLTHINHVMKNLKLEYEKLYQKKQDLENES